ncbi:MAG: exodeoxyribonuclease III [Spirochaetes bacterium]|nr:exodeoxyribonuclease III [Spirochaetota bacterium]
MKIISWNVNGLRAVLKKGFPDFLASENPDIICLQEIKALPEQVDIDLPGHPHHFWNPAARKGYSGTAVFAKEAPLSHTTGIGIEKHDGEGRVITLELANFFLVNIYVPNAQRGLERLDYRTKEWNVDLLKYLKKLEKKKPVVFCGDLNVAHREIDLANPKSNANNAGFTTQERAGFDAIIEAGFIDTFREFTKEGGHYTWWSFMGRAREKNVGWRIDYFLISPALRPALKKSYILPGVTGSDHAPIVLEIDA